MENLTEDKRRELNNLQKEYVALLSDACDLETRLEKLKKRIILNYEENDALLDSGR